MLKIFNKINMLCYISGVIGWLLRNRRAIHRVVLVTLALCGATAVFDAQAQIAFRSAAQGSSAGTIDIAYGGVGTFVTRADAGSINPGFPAGTAAGDLLITQVLSREEDAIVTMNGWNLLFTDSPVNDYQVRLYWRVATGGDPNTVTQSGTSNLLAARMTRFTGTDPNAPIQNAGTVGSPVQLPGANWSTQAAAQVLTGTETTTAANAMLIVAAFNIDDSLPAAPPGACGANPAFTTLTQSYASTTTAGRDGALWFYYGLQTTAGAKGPFCQGQSNGNDRNHGVLFALRPAPSVSNLVVNVPAGTTTGDVMIASIAAGPCSATNGGACTVTINPPAGWTQIGTTINQTGGGNFGNRLAVFQRVVTGAEPANYTWTFGGTPAHSGAAGGIMTFSGVDTTTPVDAQLGQATASGAAHQANGITTTVANTMLVGSFAVNSAGTWFAPAGMTEQVDVASLTTPNNLGISLEMTYEARAAIGATAARAATASTPPTNDTGTTHLLALRPRIIPTLVSATLICGSTTQVEVVFSTPVIAATAQNAANYALDGSVTVSAAVLGADNRVITLTTSPLAYSRTYTLTVNNVATPSGGVIATNSQITFFSEGGYLSGLRGNYFPNMTLTGTSVQRVDGPVDFNWAVGAPGVAGIGANNFSVRWEGFVTPTATGNHTFRTRSDDGVRLYVNGNLVINNWTDHSATDNDSAAIALNAGQRYPVIMEFYENGGDAVAQLSWSGPDTGGFQFIPRSALSHFCGLPTPGAIYTLDETTWNGTAGEVKDTSGNGFDGTAMNGTIPVPAQVCNGAQLNGTDRYIQVNNLSNLLNATASLAFWINTTQTGNNTNYLAPGVTGVEQAGGANDIFWGWLDAAGRIGIAVGDVATTKSTVAINNGVWRHVVLTRDHLAGQYKIYIDGVLDASGAIATGVIGTGFSSIGRIDDTGGTPVYLDGRLDEVRIYGQVLTDAEVLSIRDITRPCTSSFSHIRIEHTGTGLTCEPATVTVKACADVACTTLYPGPVTTILSPTGWVGGNTINFTSSTTAFFRRTTPGTITMGAGTTSPAPSSATLCFNGLTQTCDLNFQDTGFIFSAIPTQTAATTSANQTIRAVRKSDSSDACVGLFTGNVNIDLASQCVNPATCQAGQQVTINNNGATAIAANPGAGVSTWTTKSLTFGANSTATFTLNYPDVGAIRLNARHNINGSGDYMTGVSNDFVVRPAGFTVTNIQRTSDAVANPAAANAAGAVFMKAGENITLTVTARNSSNNPTPNYGKESVPEGVRLTTTLAPGLGLTSNPVLGNGTIAGGAFTGGVATVTNVTWGEVGIINITPGIGDTDYLGTGNVTGTTTGNIGRFTPHHFDVSANAPMFTTACGPGAFTYVGQRFNYAVGMEPVMTVTARNLAGTTTQNYKGTTPANQAFFKITTGSLTGKAYTAATGTLDISTITAPDPAIVAVGDGTGTLTFNSGTGLAFTRTTPVAQFNAEISLAINVIDTDSVAYSTNPARFGQATANNGIAFSAGKDMRFGRLRLIGASGSQLLPLRVPFEAQYWTGTFFATNAADTCTTVGSNNVGLGNYIGGLGAGETTVSAVTSPLVAGRGTITLSAPGAGNNGSVDLAINLGSASPAAACPAFTPAATAAGLTHLRGQWCGGAYDKDPSARARFGISSGADERIYMRENY
jgi:MSHA biogenesis protein MshQ